MHAVSFGGALSGRGGNHRQWTPRRGHLIRSHLGDGRLVGGDHIPAGIRGRCVRDFLRALHLVLPVLMSEVDSDSPSCLELHGRELLENLVPDGAHHVSLLPGVDIRRGLLEPVSQVLALVPRYMHNPA